MEPRPNTLATVSLVCGILLVVFYFLGFCMALIPFLGLLVYPFELFLAFLGLITGILGYRTAQALDGQGQVPALVGAFISGGWMLMQALLMGLVFLIGGSLFLLEVLNV